MRAQLCDVTASNVLLACDEGAGPPSSECTKTVQANAYCCPVPAEEQDAGTDAPSSASGVNPYGVPYPTDNIGTKPRAGSVRGDRIANASFQGYAPGKTTLGTVSFADLYDPQGKTHDVVIVVAGGLWDAYTPQTLNAIKASTKRIATLAVLGEGTTPGAPATLANLATWRTSHSFATTALDAGFKVFGSYFDATAVPFVMFIDARTMEIASAGVGGITTTQAIDSAVTGITSRAASY
ncbi:MAG: hypothetical protein KF819_11575 [Labilithrix sp.]|nr:hypothetical protein [Labilithrix sp.]